MWVRYIYKLNKIMKYVKLFEEFNEEVVVKPNNKLEKGTGYPYAMFYLSTQATNIMIDFENLDHIKLIKMIANQESLSHGFLTPAEMSKGKRMFKKILGENVAYSKYDGADCTYRLTSTPNTDLDDGKQDWFKDGNKLMINYIEWEDHKTPLHKWPNEFRGKNMRKFGV